MVSVALYLMRILQIPQLIRYIELKTDIKNNHNPDSGSVNYQLRSEERECDEQVDSLLIC